MSENTCYVCGGDIDDDEKCFQIVKGETQGESYISDVVMDWFLCERCAPDFNLEELMT